MQPIEETPFIVVDIETTGSNPQKNRMTEIACVTLIDGEIEDKWSSLVNPRQFIPQFIADMTGITNEMVYAAPEIDEVLPIVKKILSNPAAVFVAHNARFDWGFIQETMIREGFGKIDMPRLCTLKLSRRLLRKDLKKNVGSLAKYFSAPMKNRHRAMGDAFATAHILAELIAMAKSEHEIDSTEELLKFQNSKIKNYKKPLTTYNRLKTKIESLADEPGVYYFLDKNDTPLYIGKAKSLKKRVNSYFGPGTTTSKKISDMLRKTVDFRYQNTDSELSALLLESKEIKKYKPKFNSVDKTDKYYPVIKLKLNEDYPVFELANSIESDGAEYYGPFRSERLARIILDIISKQFKLRQCEKFPGNGEDIIPCFYHQIDRCLSPCSRAANQEEYYAEIDRARRFLSGFSESVTARIKENMVFFSNNLDYERAAIERNNFYELKKLFDRRDHISTAINDNNFVLLSPASARDKIVELFFVKAGKPVFQKAIGRKAPLKEIFKRADEIFYKNGLFDLASRPAEVRAMQIVSDWIFSKRNDSKVIYVNGKTIGELESEIESALRRIDFSETPD